VRAERDAICAYLIDRDAIGAFEQRVANLTSAEPHLRFELSGPFPAYDFVQMDFGG
jgi:gas vesicle protein GvpL/GvpF